jgi:hypothetical protein
MEEGSDVSVILLLLLPPLLLLLHATTAQYVRSTVLST